MGKQSKHEPLTADETALIAKYNEEVEEQKRIDQADLEAKEQLERETEEAKATRSAGKPLTEQQRTLLAQADQRQEAAELALPPSHRNCGLLGCVSSPYLQAKLGYGIVGRPVGDAIGLAGAPTASVTTGSVTYLTWRRVQQDRSALYVCEETVSVRNNRIGGYRFDGNC